MVVGIGALALFVLVCAVSIVLITEQREQERATAEMQRLTEEGNALLASQDVVLAKAAFNNALVFYREHQSSLRTYDLHPLELLNSECDAVLGPDALRPIVVSLSDDEFRLFVEKGTSPALTVYKTPLINEFARRLLDENRGKAIELRREMEIAREAERKRKEDQERAARKRQGEVKAIRAGIRVRSFCTERPHCIVCQFLACS